MKQRRAAVSAIVLGLALAAPAGAGLFDRGPATDIPALLARLPASAWSADLGGFSAFDLAALRNNLGLDWPESWPDDEEDRDEARHDALSAMLSHITPTPKVLAPWGAWTRQDPLQEWGLNALLIEGVAETALIGRDGAVVVAGRDLADVDRAAAMLGPPQADSVRGEGVQWLDVDTALPSWRDGAALVLVPPDVVAFQDMRLGTGPLFGAIDGTTPSVADLPAVAALLEAVNGPSSAQGDLVALWALHPDSFARVLNSAPDGWPRDADLPEYQLIGLGLRYAGDTATSMLVLVYDDTAAAIEAHAEMNARVPLIQEQLEIAVDTVSVIETHDAQAAVVVLSTGPRPTLVRSGRETAYHGWTREFFVYLDLRIIAP